MTQKPARDLAKEIFPIDVYCDVIPHATNVFCNADNRLYDLQQLNGEVLRKDIEEAILFARQEAEKLGEEVERLKKLNERYLWNLGGCSTYALGYDLTGGHNKEMALPALEDVLKLALEKANWKKLAGELVQALKVSGHLKECFKEMYKDSECTCKQDSILARAKEMGVE